MIKKFAISSIIAAGLLLACSDVTDSRTDPLSPTASVSVSVIDAVTGEPIPGASVSVLTLNNGGRSTDAAGRVYYDDVIHGTYEVVVSKPGYVGLKYTANITAPTATGVGDATGISQSTALVQSYYILGNAAWTVSLPPETGSIEGTVLYYTDALNTKRAPAAGATIRADLLAATTTLLERQFETTADENGYFRFDNLPAGSNVGAYTVSVLNYESADGITTFYAQSMTGTYTIAQNNSNNPVPTGTTVLQNRARVSDLTLVSYTRTVTGSDPIEFIFSDEIDTTLILRSDIRIGATVATTPIDIKWDANKLIITPRDPWNTNATTMTVTFVNGSAAGLTACGTPGLCITSVKGQTLNAAITSPTINILPTNIGSEAVKGLKRYISAVADSIDWNSTGPIRLRWNSVKGATQYQVYVRYSRNAETSKAWTTFGSAITRTVKGGIIDTTFNAEATLASAGILYEGDQAQFLVIASNSMYQTKFEGADILTIKDELGPKMNADATQELDNGGSNIYVWGGITNIKSSINTVTPEDPNDVYSPEYGLANRAKADTICLNSTRYTTAFGTVTIPKTGLTFSEPIDTAKVVPPTPATLTGGRTITPFFVWGDNTNASNATANICYVTSAGGLVNGEGEHTFKFQLVDKAGLPQRYQITGAPDRQWRDSVHVYVKWNATTP